MLLAVAAEPMSASDARAEDCERRRQLARSLGLPLFPQAPMGQAAMPAPQLLLDFNGPVLELRQPPPARTGAICVDFASAALQWRLQGADLLLKAVRGRRREPLDIIDATAGLGRDSYALAARGFSVRMIERSPVVAAMLENGLQRGIASDDASVRTACDRLSLCCGDAERELRRGEACDVVYLDPMFPDREGQALAKKEMQLLQQLLQAPNSDAELLAAARAVARLRVVVKRPRKAPPLAGQPPHYQLSGRAVRFDVYTC